MLKLRGKVDTLNISEKQPRLLRITQNHNFPTALRRKTALLLKEEDGANFREILGTIRRQDLPFSAVLLCGSAGYLTSAQSFFLDNNDIYLLPLDYNYLDDGDIIRVNPGNQAISAVFRKSTPNNSILLTERCNHLCLMCSQPPKDVDDSWLLEEAFNLIAFLPIDTPNIGFTGGEPTTYGDSFIQLIESTKLNLPDTSVDVLTNGRAFKNEAYAAKLGAVGHPNLTLGIPLYSDDPVRHDYVVQSQGAYDETIQGILNLKRAGVRVEIRIVIHQQTLPRLVETCEFITRNLIFVDHVALMGLEITGFTRANMNILWADPNDYRDKLSQAIEILRVHRMHCSVYNHQLCLVNKDVEHAYRKSISDWKNEYLPQCDGCSRKAECGGFFSTQIMYKHSSHIRPFQ